MFLYLPTCFLIISPFSSNKPALVLSDWDLWITLSGIFRSYPRLLLRVSCLCSKKRVSRNIRNIRGHIVGWHPVDYFENIITKRSASPRRWREGIAGNIAGNAKEERRRKRDWKERTSPTKKKRLYTRTFPPFCILSRYWVSFFVSATCFIRRQSPGL